MRLFAIQPRLLPPISSGPELHKWYQHFFQGNTAVLVGVAIIFYIAVVVIWIGEEPVILSEQVPGTHVWFGQTDLLRITDCIYVLILVGKISALFVTQVGIYLAIARDPGGFLHINGSVISSYEYLGIGYPIDFGASQAGANFETSSV